MRSQSSTLALALTLVAGTACAGDSKAVPAAAPTPPAKPALTANDARVFVDKANAELLELSNRASRAAWVQATYITDDTEAMTAEANDALIGAATRLIGEAKRFDGIDLPPELARQILLLKLSLSMPAPSDPAKRAQLTKTAAGLEAEYGKGKYCPASGPFKGQCLGQSEMERAFATTRDPAVLQDLWMGWNAIGKPLKPGFERLVELSNEGAREIGFADVGSLWRSNYDMPPDAFRDEVHRLWAQVEPLYASLHAYVRAQLVKKYGAKVVPPAGPIPAHLLGNIWAQEWGNIYDVVAPPRQARGHDIKQLLESRKAQPLDLVRYGEGFFTSLGFASLPKTFWDRSMFVKPKDRDVVCHASAWDVDNVDDLRLKMCIRIDADDFITVHHELGHNFYQRAYNQQPFLFRNGANDGFHEAVGDTIALSITPQYLAQVKLLPAAPPPAPGDDVPYLLRQGLDKIAFLPFGLLIDEWRWGVFNGETKPADYNTAWWLLRARYQGVTPPVGRAADDFDPGAKYHIPGNVPYMRYFLARLLQFQFYRGMCRTAGHSGPLYKCSFYGSKTAGEKLDAMLSQGQSKPWPVALAALTGEDKIDGNAMMEYFAPLKAWLDEQNKGQKIGW